VALWRFITMFDLAEILQEVFSYRNATFPHYYDLFFAKKTNSTRPSAQQAHWHDKAALNLAQNQTISGFRDSFLMPRIYATIIQFFSFSEAINNFEFNFMSVFNLVICNRMTLQG